MYGEWCTIYDKYNYRNVRGLWNKILIVLQQEAGLRFDDASTNSAMMKVHLAVTGGWQLVCGFFRGGNRNDIKAVPEIVEKVHDCRVPGDR